MAPQRHLPKRFNPLMTEEVPPYEVLVARRRLGQTDLTVQNWQDGSSNVSKKVSPRTLDYAHLRAPLPKDIISGIFNPSPPSYFLMRRSHDGYISATGMFKATFPYAAVVEENLERKYIKSLPTTSPEETAGNVWISPDYALKLAEEYHILPWIKALLDSTPIEVSTGINSTPKKIKPPPTYNPTQEDPSLLPQSYDLQYRSTSPNKILQPKKTEVRTRISKLDLKVTNSTESTELSSDTGTNEEDDTIPLDEKCRKISENAKLHTKSSKTNLHEPDTSKSNYREITRDIIEAIPKESSTEISEKVVTSVNVDSETGKKMSLTTTQISESEVKFAIPSTLLPLNDGKEMISQAKEMVQEAEKDESSASVLRKPKRRAQGFDENPDNHEEQHLEDHVSKRQRVNSRELKKERIKSRALLGITVTLAIGAAVQYAFSTF